jgi:hypothetical protein
MLKKTQFESSRKFSLGTRATTKVHRALKFSFKTDTHTDAHIFTIKAKTGVRCHTFRFRCYPQIGHQITHHCHPTYRPYPGKSLALIMENSNKLFQSNLYNKKCQSSIVNDRSFPSVERPSRTRPAVPLLSPPVHNFRLEIKSPKYQSLTP